MLKFDRVISSGRASKSFMMKQLEACECFIADRRNKMAMMARPEPGASGIKCSIYWTLLASGS